MSRYQEVKDRSQHIRSSQNIMHIIDLDIQIAIDYELSNLRIKRNFNNADQEAYDESIQNIIEKFKKTLSKNYEKLIGINIKDNELAKEVVIGSIRQKTYRLKEPFQKDMDNPYSDSKYKQFFREYLDTIETKLLEIAQSLKTTNPEITNEYINDILPTNPEEAKTYLQQLLESQNAGLTEEDRYKYSKLYFEKILVPFVQNNAGNNPKAASEEIKKLTLPESKILTDRFKEFAKEYLPYLKEDVFDTSYLSSEEDAKNELGFYPFTSAKAKLYIKIAEHYDREKNYKMADKTFELIKEKQI